MIAAWIVLAVAVAFLIFGPIAARLGFHPFGPLFALELRRLGRRRSILWWRLGLLALQFAGLLAVYLNNFPRTDLFDLFFNEPTVDDANALQKFGEQYLVVFLAWQQAAALLLAPIDFGGAIAQEKESHSWDFLLSSPLSDTQLVLGKFAARLIHVLSLLATGFPVLMFALFFGGISPDRVAAGFAVNVLSVVGVGSLSLWLAVRRTTLRSVLISTGFWVISTTGFASAFACCGQDRWLFFSASSPITTLYGLAEYWMIADPLKDDSARLVALHAVLTVLVSSILVLTSIMAVRKNIDVERAVHVEPALDVDVYEPLRANRKPEPDVPDWAMLPTRAVPSVDETPVRYARGRPFAVPALKDDDIRAIAWKERYFGARVPWKEQRWLRSLQWFAIGLFLFSLGMMLFVALFTSRSLEDIQSSLRMIVTIATLGALLVLPLTGLAASQSISNEVAGQTLDSLLMLPLGRSEILLEKLSGLLQRYRATLIFLGLSVFVGAISGTVNLFPVCSALVAIPNWLGFCVLYGLACSAMSRNGVTASCWYFGGLLLLLLLPDFIAPIFVRRGNGSDSVIEWMTPIRFLDVLLIHRDWKDHSINVARFVAAQLSLLSLNCLFAVLAFRRFHRHGRT